jgi:hypothetical protein
MNRLLAKKRKLGSDTFITTQPGIIATIYLSPIALLKIKHPLFLTANAVYIFFRAFFGRKKWGPLQF